jgi:hypothetical protein
MSKARRQIASARLASTGIHGSKLSTDAQRSALMARVRQKGTNPELCVREILSRLGVEFAVNVKELPGSPDIVNVDRKRAVMYMAASGIATRVACGARLQVETPASGRKSSSGTSSETREKSGSCADADFEFLPCGSVS